VDDPCFDIGGGAPPNHIKVKDPTRGISRGTSGVIPTYLVVSIKNTRFKYQSSTPMRSFVSIRSTPFMEIDDKGEKLEQRYKNTSWGEVEVRHG
jgi:hypothetical protein